MFFFSISATSTSVELTLTGVMKELSRDVKPEEEIAAIYLEDSLSQPLPAQPASQPAQTIRYILIPAQPTIPTFGDHSGPRLEDYIRKVRAAWRSNVLSTEEKADIILQSIAPHVRRELRIQVPNNDPEVMLTAIEDVYGDRRSIAELATAFFTISLEAGESIRNLSYRLHEGFEALHKAQKKIGMVLWDETILRDQFVNCLPDAMCRMMAKERVFQDGSITFLAIREFVLRWVGEDRFGVQDVEMEQLEARAAQMRTQDSNAGVE